MRRIIAILLLFGTAACATTEKYEARLNAWLDRPEGALIEAWGPPNSFYESGGKKYLSYTSSTTGYVPGTAPSYRSRIVGNRVYTDSYGGTPGWIYNLHCRTTFTVEDGVIKSWRWQGNDCKSR